MASVSKAQKKRGATKKANSRTKISGWLWLATGLLIGLFIAFLVFLRGQPQQDSIVKKEVIEKKAQQKSQDSKTLDYDFYKILPKLEVVTSPEEHEDVTAKKGKSQSAKKIDKPGIYVVQAGSFQRHGDADRRKANLALLGIASKIVAVKMDDGKTWHRVQIGPFEDLQQLNETRDILAKNRIDTLLLKVKG
jgi:cell division protein FtsN